MGMLEVGIIVLQKSKICSPDEVNWNLNFDWFQERQIGDNSFNFASFLDTEDMTINTEYDISKWSNEGTLQQDNSVGMV